jgi:hypothetical protein
VQRLNPLDMACIVVTDLRILLGLSFLCLASMPRVLVRWIMIDEERCDGVIFLGV